MGFHIQFTRLQINLLKQLYQRDKTVKLCERPQLTAQHHRDRIYFLVIKICAGERRMYI